MEGSTPTAFTRAVIGVRKSCSHPYPLGEVCIPVTIAVSRTVHLRPPNIKSRSSYRRKIHVSFRHPVCTNI